MKNNDILNLVPKILPDDPDADLRSRPPLRDKRLRNVDVLEAIEMEIQKFMGLKELRGSKNRGQWVDDLNMWMGVPLGSPYCLTGLLFCLKMVETKLSVKFDLPKLAGTQEFYRLTSQEYKVDTPKRGCIGIYQLKSDKSKGHAFYCGDMPDPEGMVPTAEFNIDMTGDRDGEGNQKFERSINGDNRFTARGWVDLSLCWREV